MKTPRTSPVDKTPASLGSLADRLAFEALISDLSSRFVSLRPDEVDGEINNALRVVCDALGIDLAVLWQWPLEGPAVITPTHIYSVLDVALPAEPMQQADYPWTTEQVLAGRMFAISTLDDLPAEASVDRETCRRYGIKSALCLPLLLGGESPVGALGLNALRAERDWPDTLIQRLRLVADIFTSALDRGRREQRLQDSERRLAAGSALAGLAFYEVNFAQRAIIIGDRLRDLVGFAADQNQGLRFIEFWVDHLHPGDRTKVLALREQLHSGELEQLSIEYRFLHPDRGERWIQHVASVTSRDARGRTVKSYGALRDITEFRRAEEAMRDLSRRLIHAHEQERALLARELHDDVTQRLAVLAIDVGRAELLVRDTSQAETMRSVREGLIRISEDIHSLAYQLHPSVLEELGLIEALRADCDRRRRHGHLEVSLNLCQSCASIRSDAALCLFRVAQEAMNNVARHSGVHNASVTLRQMDGGLLLAVSDDGVGFDPARPGKGRSLGLASMRERVQLVNGTLDIEAAPGCGTTIVAWVPVEGEVQ
jgi:signal transduction histidine kinase